MEFLFIPSDALQRLGFQHFPHRPRCNDGHKQPRQANQGFYKEPVTLTLNKCIFVIHGSASSLAERGTNLYVILIKKSITTESFLVNLSAAVALIAHLDGMAG
jgi:hypothetical protein